MLFFLFFTLFACLIQSVIKIIWIRIPFQWLWIKLNLTDVLSKVVNERKWTRNVIPRWLCKRDIRPSSVSFSNLFPIQARSATWTVVEEGMRGVPPESRRYSSKIIRLHTLHERPKEPREENHVSNFAHNNFSWFSNYKLQTTKWFSFAIALLEKKTQVGRIVNI